MTEALINHLWQSTLFALSAALATLAFRRNSAGVRFLLWWAASLKFLIPFSVFVLIGTHLRASMAAALRATPPLPLVIDQITQPGALMMSNFGVTPAANAAAQSHSSAWAVILVIWAFG